MIFNATITSQGQVTIPAKIRKKLNFDKNRRIIIKLKQNRVILEPEPDLLAMAGVLKNRALKNKSIKEVIKIEKNAVVEAVTERYRKKMKKMGILVPE